MAKIQALAKGETSLYISYKGASKKIGTIKIVENDPYCSVPDVLYRERNEDSYNIISKSSYLKNISINIGDRYFFTKPTIYYEYDLEDTSYPVSYGYFYNSISITSSDTSVVSIDGTKLVAKKPGTSTIIIKDGSTVMVNKVITVKNRETSVQKTDNGDWQYITSNSNVVGTNEYSIEGKTKGSAIITIKFPNNETFEFLNVSVIDNVNDNYIWNFSYVETIRH